MIKDKLINIMDFISETNLTEEYFYSNKGKYPVYSGQTSNDGIVALIDSYKETEECVSFTSYGSAGKLSYRKGKYSIGRNALGLKLKEEYKDKIILKWFAYKFQNVFYRRRIGDIAGQKSLNQILLKNLTIAIPSIEIQNQQLALYEKLNSLLYSISDLQSELDNFLNHKFTELDYISHDIIGNIFNIKGGNCGLTEHFIYQNQPTNENEKIPFFTGSIDYSEIKYVSKDSKIGTSLLKIFKSPSIIVVRKGLAGRMKLITKDSYTINDDAYVFELKESWKDKINLRWFMYQYKELFSNLVTSKSDNATFNKEYAERQNIGIVKKEMQDQIAEKLIKIDKLKSDFDQLENEIQDLLEYEIV